MVLGWMEDSVLYEFNALEFKDITSRLTPSKYESIDFRHLENGNLEIKYTWIDPIRMKDKIIARDQKTVTFWFFCNKFLMSCFGNSESAISYAILNLSKKAKAEFKRVDTFDHWYQFHYPANNWFATLTGVHIKKNPSAFDERDILKLNIKELTREKLNESFDKKEITNLTFRYGNTTFHIDLASVISFADTASEKEIYSVVKNIVEELRKKHD